MLMIKSMQSALPTAPTLKDTPAMLIPPKLPDYTHMAYASVETNTAKPVNSYDRSTMAHAKGVCSLS